MRRHACRVAREESRLASCRYGDVERVGSLILFFEGSKRRLAEVFRDFSGQSGSASWNVFHENVLLSRRESGIIDGLVVESLVTFVAN